MTSGQVHRDESSDHDASSALDRQMTSSLACGAHAHADDRMGWRRLSVTSGLLHEDRLELGGHLGVTLTLDIC